MKSFLRVCSFFQKQKLETEMAEEMRHHIELQMERNIAAGMKPDEARYAALRAFGGIAQIQESARDVRGLRWVHDFGRDLRFALRMIAKTPVVSTVIVFSLALGLGANTAVFSWIHTVALEPLPGVPDGRHLLVIEQKTESGLIEFASAAEWRDIREQAGALVEVGGHSIANFNLEANGEVQHLWGEFVTENFLPLLGVQPQLGRWPTREEDLPGSAPVAVISHRLWQKQFNGQADVLGRVIRLNGANTTIIGVAPAAFQGGVSALAFDIWMPQGRWWKQDDRKQRAFQLFARLRPGTDAEQADAGVALVFQRLAQKFPESNRGITADVLPLWRSRVGAEVVIVPVLATMQVVTVLLLLVVCTNTANLLLAQATARSKEIAIRLSLGAGRARVVRQLMTEGLVLALAGAMAGTLIAFYGLWLINSIPKPTVLPIAIEAHFEPAELMFSVALAVVCTLVFALVPALQTTRANVGEALKLGGRTSGAGPRKIQDWLVGAEIGLTLVIVILAGLFVKSFQHARFANPGFDSRQVMLGVIDPTAEGYGALRIREFSETLLARVQEQPGVRSAALTTWVPLDLRPMRVTDVGIEGAPVGDDRRAHTLWQEVSHGYFATLRLDLVEGRDFSSVAGKSAGPEVVINEEFRRRYLADGQSVLGRRLTARGATYRIVGVARTAKYGTLSESPQPMAYFSLGGAQGNLTLMVRTGQEPAAAFPALRRVVRGLDAGMPLYDQRTLEQHLDQAMILRVIPAKILSMLGPLALFLAVTGLYSVLAYAVTCRTHEIGVRMALGATTRGVVFLVLRQAMLAVSGGIALGWIGAYLASVRLSRELVEVPAGDPLLFIILPLLLATVAALACWLPAKRAAKVDPMIALRAE